MRGRKYVIAGSYRQAQMWAESRGLSPREWRYVGDVWSLRGTRDVSVVWTGTWHERRDVEELRETIGFVGGMESFEPTISTALAAGKEQE